MPTDLHADCSACQGLCCVALPFNRSADFPEDKAAGAPCHNLRVDDACSIHDRLRPEGWVGCTVFDCYGAGQRVTATHADGRHWRTDAGTARTLFAAFPVVHQLHEMLWHLSDPATTASKHARAAARLAAEVDALASLPATELLALDITAVRTRVAMVLRSVSDDARGRAQMTRAASTSLPRTVRPGGDLVGAALRGADLRAAPLRGALLLGADLRDADLRDADLLGTDLRGADIRGADLRDAMFLTRPQASAARGDERTRLPERVARPLHWER